MGRSLARNPQHRLTELIRLLNKWKMRRPFEPAEALERWFEPAHISGRQPRGRVVIVATQQEGDGQSKGASLPLRRCAAPLAMRWLSAKETLFGEATRAFRPSSGKSRIWWQLLLAYGIQQEWPLFVLPLPLEGHANILSNVD